MHADRAACDVVEERPKLAVSHMNVHSSPGVPPCAW